jgi:hypothetical protein
MRTARRCVLSVIAVLAAVLAVANVPVAHAAGSRASQAHEVAGGVVRVNKDGHALDLTVTRESGWDINAHRPRCMAPANGERAVDFDVNWRAVSSRAKVPGVHMTVATAHGIPFKLTWDGAGCHVFRHWKLTSQRPDTQTVFGAVAYLKGSQTLGRLRITVDGHQVRLRLKKSCDLMSADSPGCAPRPTIHIS